TGWSRRRRLALVGAGFVALTTGIFLLIWLIREPKPSRLEILVADHPSDLSSPLYVYGEEAARAARQLHSDQLKVEPHSFAVDPEPWRDLLDRCNSTLLGNTAAKKVILFLAAPGGADDRGLYLIPNGADPRNPSHFLRLEDLLDKLAQLPAS